MIVKIVTTPFSHNLANKDSKFISRKDLHSMKVKRVKFSNYLIVNGKVVTRWKTMRKHSLTYRKLKRLTKRYLD